MALPQFYCEILTWKKICRLTEQVASALRQEKYKPDIMVAIARGGWIPARLLCDYLNLTSLASIRIEHYTAGATRYQTARLAIPLNVAIKNKDVLLVDDVSDSGDTLELAINHLQDFKPHEIRTVVLHHKTSSSYEPDYYAQKIIKWRWLIYPWALVEDISGFLDKMEPKPQTTPEAQTRLALEFAIKPPCKLVNDIMVQKNFFRNTG